MTTSIITTRKATQEDCVILAKLNYENTYDKMFSIKQDENTIILSEVDLPEPVTNLSSNYTGLETDVLPRLDDPKYIALVACLDGNPVGWVLASWKVKNIGKKLVIEGILVSNEARGKGCARALINELMTIAKNDPECIGIQVEMDTTKYYACKLLMSMGFEFSGTELYVWENIAPTTYSKEVIYFFYPL